MKSLFFRKKDKQIKIHFCSNNFDSFLKEETSFAYFQKLAEQKDIELKEFECLNNCELCRETNYVLINGEMLLANDEKELIESIENYLHNS